MHEANETGNPKHRVLVVDDEAPMCEMLTEFLCPTDSSRSSYNGNAALALMAREPFDVVISDLRMPGMSGLALLEEARQKYPQTAFLMATAVDDVDSCVSALHLGAYDYLLKPLDLSAVLKSVQSALDKKRSEIETEVRREDTRRVGHPAHQAIAGSDEANRTELRRNPRGPGSSPGPA